MISLRRRKGVLELHIWASLKFIADVLAVEIGFSSQDYSCIFLYVYKFLTFFLLASCNSSFPNGLQRFEFSNSQIFFVQQITHLQSVAFLYTTPVPFYQRHCFFNSLCSQIPNPQHSIFFPGQEQGFAHKFCVIQNICSLILNTFFKKQTHFLFNFFLLRKITFKIYVLGVSTNLYSNLLYKMGQDCLYIQYKNMFLRI